jgi:hypothetical protein
MPVYILRKGNIETDTTGEVVGASRAYIHLLCEDITNVIGRAEARGIARSHEEDGLPAVQVEQRAFRKYNGSLLSGKVSKPRGRRAD